MTLHGPPRSDDVILDEYNHRLFNTIHVIAVETSRCARVTKESDIRPALHDLGERLQALAALHRLLAVQEDRGLLEDHCREVCLLLIRVFGRKGVIPWLRMEDIPLSREQYAKIAMMVVELSTNCLKHSLIEGVEGRIWIDLRERRGWVELFVSDSAAAPVRKPGTPRVLKALAESLGGEAFVLDRNGYTAGVRIPYAAPNSPKEPIYVRQPSAANAPAFAAF